MQQTFHLPGASRSSGLCLARVLCAGAFAALLIWEWSRWPNGSPLLGPLGIIWYNSISGESLALAALSLIALFAFLLKPHAATALISVLGVVNWLFWGVMALGIGC